MFHVLLCSALSSFAHILMGKRERELVALLCLSSWGLVTIIFRMPFLTVPWADLQCVTVIFPDHTHLFSESFKGMQWKLVKCCLVRALTT